MECNCISKLKEWIETGIVSKYTPIDEIGFKNRYSFNPYYIRTICDICGYDNININTIQDENTRYIIGIKFSYLKHLK